MRTRKNGQACKRVCLGLVNATLAFIPPANCGEASHCVHRDSTPTQVDLLAIACVLLADLDQASAFDDSKKMLARAS